MNSMNPLDQQLRREAERTRPAFSETLHARLRQTVLESPRAAPSRGPRRVAATVLAIAATAAVATGLLFPQGERRPPAEKNGPNQSPPPEVAIAIPPSAPEASLETGELLDEGDRLVEELLELLARAVSDDPWSPAVEEAKAAVLSRVPVSAAFLDELVFESNEGKDTARRTNNE